MGLREQARMVKPPETSSRAVAALGTQSIMECVASFQGTLESGRDVAFF